MNRFCPETFRQVVCRRKANSPDRSSAPPDIFTAISITIFRAISATLVIPSSVSHRESVSGSAGGKETSSELALSNFYAFDLGPAYGIQSVYKKPYPTFYLLKAIGELFREYPIQVKAERIAEHLVFAGGQSENGKKRTLLVSSFKGEERKIRIQIKGWQAPRVQIQTLTPDGFQPCEDAERDAEGFILRKAPGAAVFRIREKE